ncbi:MAG TPA: hypothetical protein VH230_14200, partial [Stellaceae bacterium]|nr:hypothetical protein [Stellaceae bacterium]
ALAAELDAKAAAAFAPAAILKPGTRLVREWHGRAAGLRARGRVRVSGAPLPFAHSIATLIDVVVTYKIDRLARALSDLFRQIAEAFEARGVPSCR